MPKRLLKTVNFEASKRLELPKLKKAARGLVSEKFKDLANEKAGRMEVQGALARLLEEEDTNMEWKSLIFSVPRGVMAWAARAATNSLASPDNLARWRKIVHPKCPLCPTSPCTLGHLLNNCKEMLDRYEWRHNNVVNFLREAFSAQRLDGIEIYADLEGHRVNGVTIPAEIAITGLKPDLVIINRKVSPPEVRLVELTVPWDTAGNMEAAFTRKTDRYKDLCKDIEAKGFKAFNLPLEIGSRGFINKRNKGLISHLCNIMKIRKVTDITRKCSKLSLLGSFMIWNSRHSTDWSSGGFLKP